MAYEFGIATDHYDLLTKINTFVTTTIPLAEQYVVERNVATGTDWEIIWKAPGLSTFEEIFFGIKTYQSVPSDYYNFKIAGFTGYVPLNEFEYQAGASPMIGVPLWNQQIPYLLVANGQRIILSIKIENVYQIIYLGKYLPYATPFQYPYPLVAMGSLPSDSATRYSDTSYNSGFVGGVANLSLRHVDGLWKTPDTFYNTTTHVLRNSNDDSTNPDGYFGIHHIVLSDDTPDVYGELDGMYMISGYNNAAENIGIKDSISYFITRNIYRTGFKDYIAIRLT